MVNGSFFHESSREVFTMKIKVLVGVLAAFAFTGCASTYEQQALQTSESKLDKSKAVLISTPPDGTYGHIEYPNSGKTTANAIKAAFNPYADKVDITSECHGKECLQSIDSSVYGYYVQPYILQWEERNTEWSGKSDRVEVQVNVYDAASGDELISSTYSGKSKWMTLGGDHVPDLLPEPTKAFVDGLYE